MSETRSTVESELNEFLAYLGSNGLPSGVGERVRAIRVVQRFGTAEPSPRWKPLLCPIFARNPGEQERFSQAFDFFFDESKYETPPPLPGQTRLVELSETRSRPRSWQRLWQWALVALILVAVVELRVPERLFDLANATILSKPDRPPLPDSTRTPRNVPGMNRRQVEQKRTVYNKRLCAGWECISRGWRPWALGAPLVLLMLGLIGASTSRWKQVQLRRREGRRSPPLTWPVVAEAPRLAGYRETLANAARAMNQRLAAESDRLDVPATIRATVRAGGFPSIRFRREQLLPEYLLLIEQRTTGDHFAAWWSAIASELQALGVRVDCYYHGGDSRRVWSAGGAVTLTTARLLELHPCHSVLLLGESALLLNAYSGELTTWAAMLKSRENRAVLTPEASFEWGQTEAAVGRHLTVLPARVRHLPAVLKSFDPYERRSALRLAEAEETAAMPDKTLEESADGAEGPNEGTGLALQLYFDPAVFQWLCACAVHPELQWELTVELGRTVDPTEAVMEEAKLLQLIRLGWFRQGRIPGPWRAWLVKQLEPATERRVRQFLIAAMQKNRAPQGTYARDWQDLQICAQQYWLAPGDARLQAELELAMADLPAADVNRDVLLRQLKDQWKERAMAEKLASAPQLQWRGFLRRGWKGILATGVLVGAAALLSHRLPIQELKQVTLPPTYEYEPVVPAGGVDGRVPPKSAAVKLEGFGPCAPTVQSGLTSPEVLRIFPAFFLADVDDATLDRAAAAMAAHCRTSGFPGTKVIWQRSTAGAGGEITFTAVLGRPVQQQYNVARLPEPAPAAVVDLIFNVDSMNLTANSPAHPAQPGSVVLLFSKYLGQRLAFWNVSNPTAAEASKISAAVRIAGRTVPLLYSGKAGDLQLSGGGKPLLNSRSVQVMVAGMMQFTVQLPADLPNGAAVPVLVSALGVTAGPATIAIGPPAGSGTSTACAALVASDFRAKGGGATAAANDYQTVAERLKVEPNVLRAVASVAGGPAAFLPDGRPVILFERHIFSQLTNHVFDVSDISNPQPGGYGPPGANQYDRLKKAAQLSCVPALESASWGRFQVMGRIFAAAGYPNAVDFVQAQMMSESGQMTAWGNFLKSAKLDAPLRAHDWTAFARGYFGPTYAENGYDKKLAAAYAQSAPEQRQAK